MVRRTVWNPQPFAKTAKDGVPTVLWVKEKAGLDGHPPGFPLPGPEATHNAATLCALRQPQQRAFCNEARTSLHPIENAFRNFLPGLMEPP